MNTALLIAAGLLVALGIAHSYLGERYILIRLFRRNGFHAARAAVRMASDDDSVVGIGRAADRDIGRATVDIGSVANNRGHGDRFRGSHRIRVARQTSGMAVVSRHRHHLLSDAVTECVPFLCLPMQRRDHVGALESGVVSTVSCR